MLMDIFDLAFRFVAPIVAMVGGVLICFYLTVMFDDKGTYDCSGRDFIKWLGASSSTAITDAVSENDAKKDTKED